VLLKLADQAKSGRLLPCPGNPAAQTREAPLRCESGHGCDEGLQFRKDKHGLGEDGDDIFDLDEGCALGVQAARPIDEALNGADDNFDVRHFGENGPDRLGRILDLPDQARDLCRRSQDSSDRGRDAQGVHCQLVDRGALRILKIDDAVTGKLRGLKWKEGRPRPEPRSSVCG